MQSKFAFTVVLIIDKHLTHLSIFLRDYEENMKSAAKFSNTSRCKPAISNPWRFNRFIAVIFI